MVDHFFLEVYYFEAGERSLLKTLKDLPEMETVIEEEFEPPATEYFKVIERLEKNLDGYTDNLTAVEIDREKV